MDKIIIFGANGCLANHLTVFYKSKGIKTIGVSRNQTFTNNKFDMLLTCDYSVESMREILCSINPSILINTIAETDLVKCETNMNLAYLANVSVAERLAHAVETSPNLNLPYMVQISTDNVYSSVGYSSEEQTTLLNNYALTKYVGEYPFSRFPNSIILRTNYLASNVQKKSLLDWMLDAIHHNKKVDLYQDVFFNPTTPENIAKNILIAFKRRVLGVVNIGCRHGWSKADLFIELSRKLNSSIQNISYSNCPQFEVRRPLDMRMNTAKAKQYGLEILENGSVLENLSAVK